MLNLAGYQGTTLANDSVEAVRKVIERNQATTRGEGLRHRSRGAQ